MKSETGCARWKRSALAGLRGTDSIDGERGVARPGEAEQGPHALDVSCRRVMGSVRTARSSRLARPSEGRFKRSGRRGRRGASRRKGSSEVQRRVRRASLLPSPMRYGGDSLGAALQQLRRDAAATGLTILASLSHADSASAVRPSRSSTARSGPPGLSLGPWGPFALFPRCCG
jgi:hypothetical protein